MKIDLIVADDMSYQLVQPIHRRCHEKISYVSNYAFFILLHKWADRGQTHRLEKLQ